MESETFKTGQRVRVLVAVGEHPDRNAVGLATVVEDGNGYVRVRSDIDGKTREVHQSRMIHLPASTPAEVPPVAVAPVRSPTGFIYCEFCPKPYGHKGACAPAPEVAGRGEDGEAYMVGGSGRRGGIGRE